MITNNDKKTTNTYHKPGNVTKTNTTTNAAHNNDTANTNANHTANTSTTTDPHTTTNIKTKTNDNVNNHIANAHKNNDTNIAMRILRLRRCLLTLRTLRLHSRFMQLMIRVNILVI